MDAFDINCRRTEYNAEYDRLKQLLVDGCIDSNHFIHELSRIKKEYSDILDVVKEGE